MSLKFAGRKRGMTKIFDESGQAVVCTVIELEPNVITQVKTKEKEGYNALQMGGITLSAAKKKNITKPMQGHFASKKVEPMRVVFESRVSDTAGYELGQSLDADYFKGSSFVDVTGVSKGKGFQGVMKRHGFKGGPGAHGSGFHRHGGSTGMRSTPGRTFKNQKMPGHMGNEKITAECLRVIRVDAEKHLLLVKGAVPGPNNGIIFVRKSVKKAHKQA